MSAKETAIKLRKAGYSYSYIHERTGLAKSTLSYHLSSVPFTPNDHTVQTKNKAQQASAQTKHQQKQVRIEKAEQFAQQDIGRLTKRDLFIAGIAIYAGEGSKTNNLVRLVNADERVIRLFLAWLELLGVSRSHVVARIHGYPDTDLRKAENYWSKVTSLPVGQFQRPCIDTRTGKDRKRSGVHQYGTLHVTVRANGEPEFGTALARKIKAYMDILLS